MRTMYTLGFIFDNKKQSVLLIKKNRPEDQKGKLNGVGGHIEKNEDPLDSFVREVHEETSLILPKPSVELVGYIQSPEWLVHVYTTVYDGNINAMNSLTDEAVDWYPVSKLPSEIMNNLQWLIPLSLDKLKDSSLQTSSITYI